MSFEMEDLDEKMEKFVIKTHEIPNENQKLLHSWQSIGTLIYGILATKFLKGLATSVSDQAYATPRHVTK